MDARCHNHDCRRRASFSIEMEPRYRAAFCSQACLLNWEVARMIPSAYRTRYPVKPLAAIA